MAEAATALAWYDAADGSDKKSENQRKKVIRSEWREEFLRWREVKEWQEGRTHRSIKRTEGPKPTHHLEKKFETSLEKNTYFSITKCELSKSVALSAGLLLSFHELLISGIEYRQSCFFWVAMQACLDIFTSFVTYYYSHYPLLFLPTIPAPLSFELPYNTHKQ